MKKLTIVGLDMSPGTFGGVKNYMKILLDHLDRDKVEVHYYSLGKSPEWYRGEDKPTKLEFIINLIKRMMFFIFFLKKNKIEIVHLNSGLTQVSIIREGILSLIAKFYGCKTLLFIHGWKKNEFEKIVSNKIKKKIFTSLLIRQDKIIVLAEQFKEKIIDLGVNEEKIFVSSTMVETNKYQTEKKTFSRPLKVLFCATILKEKGPFELLESVPLILNKYADVQFIFVGDGKDLKKLKLKTKNLGIEKNVVFTGYVNMIKKIEIFKEAHVFAFPTYYGEGFPTVILEAMAAGLPVVTTANAGLADVIENEREGYILKTMPSEPEEIAEKIIKLIENPELMKDMSNNNFIKAQKKFDAKVISNQIVKLYYKI